MKLWREVRAATVGLALIVGCSKSEPGGPATPPSASAAPVASAAAPATVASAAPSAAPADSAPEAPSREAAAAGSAGGKTQPASATSASGPKTFACGNKGQPMCPTQAWMKANMGPAAASGDGADLAKGLDYIAARAPAGMSNWGGIAKGGAAKARAGDIDGAKAACKSCHDQYKAKYKAEVRDRPF